MKGNATLLKAEALLRFVLYTSPTRTNAIPLGRDAWVDRMTAFSEAYSPGTLHRCASLRGDYETEAYIVAMLPLIRRVTDPRQPGQQIVHVTIYFARAEDYRRFKPVDQLTLPAIRQAMLCPAVSDGKVTLSKAGGRGPAEPPCC